MTSARAVGAAPPTIASDGPRPGSASTCLGVWLASRARRPPARPARSAPARAFGTTRTGVPPRPNARRTGNGGGVYDMLRRSTMLALAGTITALSPIGARAATAPAIPPVLTSAPFVRPATFHWTPASDPANASQGVYRSSGVCSQPQALGGPIVTGLPAGQTDFSAGPVDGVYCYHIRTTDLLGGTAEGPGLTVAVDTTAPAASVAIAGQAPGGTVGGTVGVVGTSADAVSGVASSTLHVGAVGGCAAGPVIAATWDTTGFANGVYEVCNVVADAAGHVTTARTVVTVSN